MKFKVVWSEFAEKEIEHIYKYYKINANKKIASSIVLGIIKSTNVLKKFYYIGKIEPLLEDSKLDYRYIIHKNHKIIYTVDTENKLIKVSDVFDTRQNPIKIKREKQ